MSIWSYIPELYVFYTKFIFTQNIVLSSSYSCARVTHLLELLSLLKFFFIPIRTSTYTNILRFILERISSDFHRSLICDYTKQYWFLWFLFYSWSAYLSLDHFLTPFLLCSQIFTHIYFSRMSSVLFHLNRGSLTQT